MIGSSVILKVSPGEARTHNPGMSIDATILSYKYRALTNCATGEPD